MLLDPQVAFREAAKRRCIEIAEETAEVLKTFMPEDTGAMKASVRVEPSNIGGDVVIGVAYWKYVNYGTGIYGPTGQRITPTHSQYLHFFIDGAEFFVTSIAGQRGQHFVERTKEFMKRSRLKGLPGQRGRAR
jgi:hypothetical protein